MTTIDFRIPKRTKHIEVTSTEYKEPKGKKRIEVIFTEYGEPYKDDVFIEIKDCGGIEISRYVPKNCGE